MNPNYLLALILVIVLVPVIWSIGIYNSLIKLRNHCREAWSNIDTELKRRYDLIPNLVAIVKGYTNHEHQTLEAVIRARNIALDSTGSPAAQAKDENLLVTTLRQLFAVVENYPVLQADQHFLKLQAELVNTEDRIQAARRFYNGNVRDFNTRIEVVPSNLIAGAFDFQQEEFFEIESAGIRAVPAVHL